MDEDWIIFGYDMHDGEVFVYREAERPDPVKFALDIMKDKYDNYDEETSEWYDRAGDSLSEAITEHEGGSWTIDCRYDGTFEGMKVEAKPLIKLQGYLWED